MIKIQIENQHVTKLCLFDVLRKWKYFVFIKYRCPNKAKLVTGLNIVKDDIQKLQTETKLICKRIETQVDKIKSFKSLD